MAAQPWVPNADNSFYASRTSSFSFRSGERRLDGPASRMGDGDAPAAQRALLLLYVEPDDAVAPTCPGTSGIQCSTSQLQHTGAAQLLRAAAAQLLRATASRLHGATAAALCTATVQLPSGPTATTSLPSPPSAATATTSAPRWVRGSTTTAAAAAIACTPAAAAAAARSSGWRRCRGAAHRGGGGGAERRITARRSQRRARDDDAQAPRLFGGAGTHTQKAWLH